MHVIHILAPSLRKWLQSGRPSKLREAANDRQRNSTCWSHGFCQHGPGPHVSDQVNTQPTSATRPRGLKEKTHCAICYLSGRHVKISALHFCCPAAPSGNCPLWNCLLSHIVGIKCEHSFVYLIRKLIMSWVVWSCGSFWLFFFLLGDFWCNCLFPVVLVVFPVLSCVSLSVLSTRLPFFNTCSFARGALCCRKKKWRSLG